MINNKSIQINWIWASITGKHFYTPANEEGGGVYWNRPVGWAVCLQNLVRTTPSLYTWQKCPFGVVDVQDTNFVKIPSRITELLALI